MIPWLLVGLRFTLGPVIVLVAKLGWHAHICFALILIAGLLSDIWDGVLARRWDAQRRGSALLTVRWTRCFILVWERR
jgi:phosphatidylglycerophosphate synthase